MTSRPGPEVSRGTRDCQCCRCRDQQSGQGVDGKRDGSARTGDVDIGERGVDVDEPMPAGAACIGADDGAVGIAECGAASVVLDEAKGLVIGVVGSDGDSSRLMPSACDVVAPAGDTGVNCPLSYGKSTLRALKLW